MIETKTYKPFNGSVQQPSFELDNDIPSVAKEQSPDRMNVLKSKLATMAKNPLFLVILTWTVMAFLLAFEVAAKK